MPLPKPTPHKLGANRHDPGHPQKKRGPNFAQTRDIREDRGERQIKLAKRPR
jgi:hypothetical protein